MQAAVSAWCVGLVGSRSSILRQAFACVEQRGPARILEHLLRRRRPREWARCWIDNEADVQQQWCSEAHARPDERTPLLSALLAKPRYAMLAATLEHQGPDPKMSSRTPSRHAVGSLREMSTSEFCKHPTASTGHAGRAALQQWQSSIVGTLLAAAGDPLACAGDVHGRCPLHYIAALGDRSLMKQLLEVDAAKATVTLRDDWGRTPAHVAAAHGHLDVAEELLQMMEKSVVAADTQCRLGLAVADIIRMQRACVGVDVLTAPAGAPSEVVMDETFLRNVMLNRPFLWKDAAGRAAATKRMSDKTGRQGVLEALEVKPSLVPYYRADQACTVEEFLERESSMSPQPADGEARPYVFHVLDNRQQTASKLASQLAVLRPEDLERHAAYLRMPQLGIGLPGAGAAMHTHHAAVNVLYIGRKKWFLVPPHRAFWSLKPSAVWAQSPERQRLLESGDMFEVEQEAGDVIFVPEGWGHCTLVEEMSIGVGQEFIPNTSMSS